MCQAGESHHHRPRSLFSRLAASGADELKCQIRRLIAIRFLLYMGAMGSFYIGVLGTLTYAMAGGATDNAVAVALINLLITVGGVQSGQLLDRLGPRVHLRICITLMVVCGLAYQVLGTFTAGVFLGAAFFGLAWGMADIVQRAYPAYLTDNADELKRINATVAIAGNIALVIGPTIGGAIVLAAPTRMVFLFMVACSALAIVPGWGFRPLRTPDEGRADERTGEGEALGRSDGSEGVGGSGVTHTTRKKGSIIAGFSQIFGSGVLTLLFWATLLSFMGYGAFDPLESLFYRDVLRVGASWMGWLSALSGVGGIAGALLAGVLPARHVNVRSLLVVLALSGVGSLIYVGTPYVAVACAGQLLLGVAFSAFGPIKDTLVQVHTPLSSIGRVNAAMSAGYNVAGVLPLLCAPALAAIFGVQGTLVGAALVVALVPTSIILLRHRALTEMVLAERVSRLRADGAGSTAE